LSVKTGGFNVVFSVKTRGGGFTGTEEQNDLFSSVKTGGSDDERGDPENR
jgi:hypothetical protein